MNYIKSGIDCGATLQTGGDRIGSKGYFIQPTVFSDVKVSLTPLLNNSNIIDKLLIRLN